MYFSLAHLLSVLCTAPAATTPTPASEVVAPRTIEAQLAATRAYIASRVHDDATTLNDYDQLMSVLKTLPQKDLETLCTTLEFAADRHAGQTRLNKAKTPYLSHLLETTYFVAELGQVHDVEALQAVILHDIVQEGKGTFPEIKKKFGNTVMTYVAEVTENASSPAEERRHHQIAAAPQCSPVAAQIQLADALYNLRDLAKEKPISWKQERIDGYFEWTQAKVERLPEVPGSLHLAVKETIREHWDAK